MTFRPRSITSKVGVRSIIEGVTHIREFTVGLSFHFINVENHYWKKSMKSSLYLT